jgi:hypothetical protein
MKSLFDESVGVEALDRSKLRLSDMALMPLPLAKAIGLLTIDDSQSELKP